MKKAQVILLCCFLILFSINTKAQDPTLLWAGSAKAQATGGSEVGSAEAMVTDDAGNVYVTGFFGGTVDFDFGSGTTNLVSSSHNNMFIAKYTGAGQLLWVKSITGTAATAIAVKKNLVVITGTFGGVVDFDPGSGVANLDAGPTRGSFILQLTTGGDYISASAITGYTSIDDLVISKCVALDGQDNIYIAGVLKGKADFDPGAGVTNMQSQGDEDLFVAKYQATGQLLWANSTGGIGYETAEAISIDTSGNIYITGNVGSDKIDMDFSATEHLLVRNKPKSNTYDLYIAKYNTNGNFIWADGIGGDAVIHCRSIVIAGSGIYLAGSFSGTFDFDPGQDSVNLVCGSNAGANFFLARYNSSGNYVWAKNFGATGAIGCYGLAADARSNLYITGVIDDDADFDPRAWYRYTAPV